MRKKKIRNNKISPQLFTTIGVLGAVTITFASLFVYKMIKPNAGGSEPPIPSDFVTITLDAGEGNTVENTDEQIFKYYVEKGTSFLDAFKEMECIGAEKDNNEFLCWNLGETNNAIPEDYIIEDDISLKAKYEPVKEGFLTITTRMGESTISVPGRINLKISRNGEEWEEISTDKTITLKNAGDQVFIRRENETQITIPKSGLYTCDSMHSLSGPIKSLYNGISEVPRNAFQYCFQKNTKLISVKNLDLSGIELTQNCYSNMFLNCTSLTTAPELPAETLALNCYQYMFSGCTSLTTAPELPAETLANNCYQCMFQGCTSLTTAPELPAETLANNCYWNMFSGCSSLISAPRLLAATLMRNCYLNMFSSCSSLKVGETEDDTIPNKILTVTDSSCCGNMFSGTSGSFKDGTPKDGMTYYVE